MRILLRALVLLLVPVCVSAQDGTVPVPAGIRMEGVPPVPAALVEGLAPYASFRMATFQAWHPTERRMLIKTAFGNVPQIHQVRAPGGARTQLTFFPGGVPAVQVQDVSYDASGRGIIFRRDTSGGRGAFQLFRYDFPTGASTLLTDGASINSAAVPARRSSRIAYTSTRRSKADRDIFVMDPTDPRTDRLLLEVSGIWVVMDWSPDDRELLVVEAPSTASETYLWRVNVETGEKTAITERGGRTVRWSGATYTPDGKSIYALGNLDSDVPRLLRRDLGTSRWVPVFESEDTISRFDLSPDGRLLAVVTDTGIGSELRIVDARTGRARPATRLPPGTIASVGWHPKGGEVAFTFAGARTFNDVYSLDPQTGRVDRWTSSEVGGASPESLPDAEIVRWKSFDGLEISGVLYRPPASFKGPRPVLINVHGGPVAVERPRGLGRSNYFRTEMGIAVIYPNIRGSSGFGHAFEQADNVMKREDAVKDIGALLDWIAAQPGLDQDRVMITGGSYGGYIAYASAIAYGDRLCGAIAGFAISDFLTYLEGTDATEPSRREDRRIEYGDPSDPEVRAFLERISPLRNASKIRIPLLVIQGAKDSLVPLAQAEQMVKAVRANGTPLWYVVFEEAGHEQLPGQANNFNLYTWILFAQEFLVK
jgi:dipeptidyl aminopeptidase/acylaminoacyl peptidase